MCKYAVGQNRTRGQHTDGIIAGSRRSRGRKRVLVCDGRCRGVAGEGACKRTQMGLFQLYKKRGTSVN